MEIFGETNLNDSFITFVWLVPMFNFGIWKLESDVFEEDEDAAFSNSFSSSFSGSIIGSTCCRKYSMMTLKVAKFVMREMFIPQILVARFQSVVRLNVCWVVIEVHLAFSVWPDTQAAVLKSSLLYLDRYKQSS